MQQVQPGPGHGSSRPSAAHNLFFALWPGDEVRAQIDDRAKALCAAGHGAHGRRVKPTRYHLTLRFLGEFTGLPQSLLHDAMNVAARLEAPAFELTLDQAGSFAHVWWLGCTRFPEALPALSQELAMANGHARASVQSPDRFTPHVTVLRGASARLQTTPIAPVAWPVREFVLIDSEVASPAPYRIVGRWPLRRPSCGYRNRGSR